MITISLDTSSSIPLYEQLYSHIKQEIRSGNLYFNEKLPSTRKLAEHLQISRNTVDLAYNQLQSEGYIESRPKSGYYVCKIKNLISYPVPESSKPIVKKEKIHYDYNFSPFSIDLEHFPFDTWRKLSRECVNNTNKYLFQSGDRQGDLSFREAIRKYLHASRNVNCTSDQIIVGAGADYLLQLLAQIIPNQSTIAMENPTYKQAYMIFQGLGHHVSPISLDDSGIKVDELEATNSTICYVTPAHQYPLGIIMPIKRRQELLQWAGKDSNRYLIEDDHDSEFRYKGKPIPSLQGMDTNNKVIYLGTFSRAIAPAIRIGYMVLPRPLLEIYQEHFSYYASTVSRLDQSLLTFFINDGYFERHLNRMRKVYKNKHDTVLHALKCFGKHIEIYNEHAGLHLLVKLSISLSESELLELAKQNSIKLYPLSDHFIVAPTTSDIYLLLGYATMNEENLQKGVTKLYKLLTPYLE